MTLAKESFFPNCSLHQMTHFSMLASRTNWLYFGHVATQPRCLLAHFTVLSDTFVLSQRSSIISCSCLPVSSSFSAIPQLMKLYCSWLSFLGFVALGSSATQYQVSKLNRALRLTRTHSSSSRFLISLIVYPFAFHNITRILVSVLRRAIFNALSRPD